MTDRQFSAFDIRSTFQRVCGPPYAQAALTVLYVVLIGDQPLCEGTDPQWLVMARDEQSRPERGTIDRSASPCTANFHQ
jgi:hypothetical protein